MSKPPKHLTWRNVVDCDKQYCGHPDTAAYKAFHLGYQYFVWDGDVYNVDENAEAEPTEWTVGDVS